MDVAREPGGYTTRMFRGVVIAAFALVIPMGVHSAAVRDVIIDHDGGVDDLIAISLLMRSPSVHVRAITICPADSYLSPATRATQLFIDRLGGKNITIAQGHSEGTNPFPAKWRQDAAHVPGIKALAGLQPTGANPLVTEDAPHHLVRLLSGAGSYTLLETGPLTNVADALKINPSIGKHIQRIFVMGGAVRVPGNVEQKGHDNSAEWNIFNQPQAAAEVFRSGIPITLIPLDATNKVPMTRRFLDKLATQPAAASELAVQAWRLVVTEGTTGYYFWDPLTAAALLDPSVVSTERLRLRVDTIGASQGRTVEDPHGSPIEVAVDASREKVEKMFLQILGR
jgi:purine nucleosidase